MTWREIVPGIYEGVPGPAPHIDPLEDPALGEWVKIRIKNSNIPTITYQEMRFHTFEVSPDNQEAFDAALSFQVRAPHHFLTLAGEPGRGKSHLAISALWNWLLADFSGCYYQAEELLDTLRAGFGRPPDDPRNTDIVLNYTKKCGLLVLDDLGAHAEGQRGEGPSWAEAKFDEIINYRWLNKGRTIFTLNVAAESLPQRVRDRIIEGQTFVLHGPSYREMRGARLRERPTDGG